MRLTIVGNQGGTNVGDSLLHAAGALGVDATLVDALSAATGLRLVDAAAWRLFDKRPALWRGLNRTVLTAAASEGTSHLVTTGGVPIVASTLRALRREHGVKCLHFSTDDPWNPNVTADWLLEALPQYDTVFTPRRANVADFARIGCTDVRYLPFAYDERHIPAPETAERDVDRRVLFVGGADDQRAAFMGRLIELGVPLALVGGYWSRYSATAAANAGHLHPDAVALMTRRAAINLCIVRRANRDGHVMRTFEIAALGACMVAERSDEHLELLGPDGDAVRYFDSPESAAAVIHDLLDRPDERARMRQRLSHRIRSAGHTYVDRLAAMLGVVRSVPGAGGASTESCAATLLVGAHR